MSFKTLTDAAASPLGYLPGSIAMTEEVYTLTGTTPDLDPDLGTIQTWTLSGASAPVDALTDGQSMTLHLTPGVYSVTWPPSTVVGTWPSGLAAGLNIIILWKVGTTLYRMYSGAGA